MSQRLTRYFSQAGKTFVAFVMAHHPTREHFHAVLNALPAAGVDIIEIGMPFSDPMADGPVIQVAGAQAIVNGASIPAILEAVRQFRTHNDATPLILMGYFNPIFHYGAQRFCADAAAAGLDGVIVVDVPLEEQGEIASALKANGLACINLVTPATPEDRVARIAASASGFLYGVSVAGVTGVKQAQQDTVTRMSQAVKRHSSLPLMIGFGIRTPESAAQMAALADGAVVGSALIEQITDAFKNGASPEATATAAANWIRPLADAVHASTASSPSLRNAQRG